MFLPKNHQKHLPFYILFVAFLITGIFIYTDYGISWDEPVSRVDNGIINYNYITSGDYKSLIEGNEKYHGPSFEIALVFAEKIFGLNGSIEIYHMRHLLTFLLFAVSVLFFYRLCLTYYKTRWLAVIGSAFLILSPRIFADAFYNSKDLALLSFFIINIYTAVRLLERPTFGNALLNAFISALTIDVRILGVIIPAFTCLILLINWIRDKDQRRKITFSTILFVVSLAAFIILFWPVLWRHPVDNFLYALAEMSHYHWGGSVLYMGKSILATNLPWHYLPVWILITTPLLYIFLFCVGLFLIVKKLVTNRTISVFDSLNIWIIIIPILMVVALNSVVYDGWRHVYFIFPSMLFIAIGGLEYLQYKLIKSREGLIYFQSGIIAYCAYITGVMIYLHPYEHVYFNRFAGSSLKEIKQNYEVDYWGLSFIEGLKYIVHHDPSKHIQISYIDATVLFNAYLLSDEEQSRLSFTKETQGSDYFLSDYRNHPEDYYYLEYYSAKRENTSLMTVFCLNEKVVERFYDTQDSFITIKNDYEDALNYWYVSNRTEDAHAHSGGHVMSIADTIVFCSTFEMKTNLLSAGSMQLYLKSSVYLKSDSNFKFLYVAQLQNPDGKTTYWNQAESQYQSAGEWKRAEVNFKLPKIEPNQTFKVFLINPDKKNFMMDDFNIDILRRAVVLN